MPGYERAKRAAFVVGVPRSGTTWTLALLAQHPHVAAVQQAAFFESLEPLRVWWESTGGYGKRLMGGVESKGNSVTTQGASYVGEVLRPEDFDRLCRPIVDHVFASLSHARGEAELIVTQTPENLMLWPSIRRLVPEARFLHVIRDPRAVLASQRAAADAWAQGVFDANAESVARTWQRYMEAAAELERSGAKYLEVRYEKLRANPVEELATIFAWLELSASTEFLKTAVENCSLNNMRNANIGPKDFVRTGLAGGWRQELRKSQIRNVEYVLAHTMRERGYVPVTANPERMPMGLAARRLVRRSARKLIQGDTVLRRFAQGVRAFFLGEIP